MTVFDALFLSGKQSNRSVSCPRCQVVESSFLPCLLLRRRWPVHCATVVTQKGNQLVLGNKQQTSNAPLETQQATHSSTLIIVAISIFLLFC